MEKKKVVGAAVAGLLMTMGVAAMGCGSTGDKTKTSCKGSCKGGSCSSKTNSCKGSCKGGSCGSKS